MDPSRTSDAPTSFEESVMENVSDSNVKLKGRPIHKRSRLENSAEESLLLENSGLTEEDEASGQTLLFNFGSGNLSSGIIHAQSNEPAGIFDPFQSMANIKHEFGEHGGVNMSIENSATFTVMEPETMSKLFTGQIGPEQDHFIYSRHFNPTVMAVSRQLAALEGTQSAYCTASGMAAISSAILQLCNFRDKIVASNRLYGGTYALLNSFLPRISGISTTFVDITNINEIENAIQKHRPKVMYFEAISNPTLTVADIPAISSIAKRFGSVVVVDNTFSPAIISPARLGADVVVHSISKFISGGGDIIAGCVCASANLISSMMGLHQGTLMLLGATMNAQVAFQVSGRLPHLGLRMTAHGERALNFAQRLEKLGLKVIYPGLPSHPQHEILKKIGNLKYGYGGLLCLDLETNSRANDLMNYLQNSAQFGFMAVSLGFSETLMSLSGESTSSEIHPNDRESVGISPGLVRFSIGYTGLLEERWGDFHNALKALRLIPLNDASKFD